MERRDKKEQKRKPERMLPNLMLIEKFFWHTSL